MQVHEHASQIFGMTRVVLLLLSCVHEADGEPIPVVGVVTAAAPDPVATQARRATASTAAARRQFTVTTGPRHGEHQPRCRDGVCECRLPARYMTKSSLQCDSVKKHTMIRNRQFLTHRHINSKMDTATG